MKHRAFAERHIRSCTLYMIAVLWFWLPITGARAQTPIDSSRFEWMQALEPYAPTGYTSKALDLGDGNLLAWWNSAADLVPPYYNDPCAAVLSPDGELLIPGQTALEHPASKSEAFAGRNGCWYQLEKITLQRIQHVIYGFSLHRMVPDYETGTFRETASYTITTIADSIANFGYTEVAVNDSVVVFAYGHSDAHEPLFSISGNRLLTLTADSLHLVSDTLMLDERHDFLIGAVDDGFFMRSFSHSMFLENDGDVRWFRENPTVGPVNSIQSVNGSIFCAVTVPGDYTARVIRQEPASGEEDLSRILATGIHSSLTVCARYSQGHITTIFGGYQTQPMEISVFDSNLDSMYASATIDTVLDGVWMIGDDFVKFGGTHAIAMRYWFDGTNLSVSDFVACPYDASYNSFDLRFVQVGGAVLAFHMHHNGFMLVPLAYRLGNWDPTGVAPGIRFPPFTDATAPGVHADAFPNPFNGNTQVRFDLPVVDRITATLYNVLGQQVAQREMGYLSAGVHEISFPFEGQGSGRYFLRIEGQHTQPATLPLTLLK